MEVAARLESPYCLQPDCGFHVSANLRLRSLRLTTEWAANHQLACGRPLPVSSNCSFAVELTPVISVKQITDATNE